MKTPEAHFEYATGRPLAASPFRLRARMASFGYALQGLWTLLRSQHNAWIHAGATLLVIGAGAYCKVTRMEWMGLVAGLMAVWAAEAFNTSLELLADALHPAFHPLVGRAKDVAAGAVLLTALGATALGIITFLPYLM